MKDIKVYGKKVCPNCDKVKSFLDSKGFEYDYVDLEEDVVKFFELKQKGIKAVPVIEVRGELKTLQDLYSL